MKKNNKLKYTADGSSVHTFIIDGALIAIANELAEMNRLKRLELLSTSSDMLNINHRKVKDIIV